MRKLFALVCMLVVLSVFAASFGASSAPVAAQTDPPLCGIMHTDKDGHVICDDGPVTAGIMHTDDAAPEADGSALLEGAYVLLSIRTF